MKIGIDIRMLDSSGIGTTIRGLLRCFTKEQMRQVELFGPKDFNTPFAHGFTLVEAPVYGLSQHWSYGRFLNRQNLAVYHMPHYDVPAAYTGKLIITIHDIIHLLFPEYSTKPFSKIYAKWMLNRSIFRAQKIICVSENSKKDVIEHFPIAERKIVVVNPAVDSEFCPVEPGNRKRILEKYKLPEGYLLYVGNLRASKNSWNLVQGYLGLKKERPDMPDLVLVGRNFYREWENSRPGPGVRMLGNVEKEDLPALYSGASLFVFPSRYEGFGLPPLEAMSCGAPVLTSRVASLPEVCGDAAEYLEDFGPTAIAQKISALLDSSERRLELKNKGFERVRKFSWEKFSQKTWDLYQEVALS